MHIISLHCCWNMLRESSTLLHSTEPGKSSREKMLILYTLNKDKLSTGARASKNKVRQIYKLTNKKRADSKLKRTCSEKKIII